MDNEKGLREANYLVKKAQRQLRQLEDSLNYLNLIPLLTEDPSLKEALLRERGRLILKMLPKSVCAISLDDGVSVERTEREIVAVDPSLRQFWSIGGVDRYAQGIANLIGYPYKSAIKRNPTEK